MSAMSESAEVKSTQNASNSDLQIEANGDRDSDQNVDEANGVQRDQNGPLIKPDRHLADNGLESIDSKTIECGAISESERDFATTVETRVTQLNGMNGSNGLNGSNGMRASDTDATNATPAPDVGSDSRRSGDGVDGGDQTSDQSSEDCHSSHTAHSTCALNCDSTDNEVIIIETFVKSDSNEVTLITDTTIKTTISSSDKSNENQSQKVSESDSDLNKTNNNNESNKVKTKSIEMTTTSSARPKQLKGLLKKPVRDRSIKTNGERKRVKFSETMQVFCDDWPQNLMPQIIALKSPTDFNLVEVQGYMFEPPVEYQDFLPFDPPPDYRDLIANSLCAFDNDLSINYIDEEDEEDNKNDHKISNEYSSKWESMILNNNESLEEEQIIGVLKEDAILQAIGSHISLPEENLCPEDFPIHFHNNLVDHSSKLTDDGNELSDITSDDGNDSQSSPTGSLQDIQSDSSITSQDTIILINTDSNDNNETQQLLTNKMFFKEMKTKNCEDINDSANSESVVISKTQTEQKTIKFDPKDDSSYKELKSETNESLICEESIEKSSENGSVRGAEEEVDSAADVAHYREEANKSDSQTNDETNDTNDTNDSYDRQISEAQLNNDRKKFNLFTNEANNELHTNHTNSFKRNLMFYENMFSTNNNNTDAKSENVSKGDKAIKQTVSHFFIQNSPQLPIITQTVRNNISDNNKHLNHLSVGMNPNASQACDESQTADYCQPVATRPAASQPTVQTSQMQPNTNNWSGDELIIEYTSEPKALVPSKRTASLSNFATAQMNTNSQFIRNTNVNDIQYLSLSRNGEFPKQWTTYNIDPHNSSQMLYQNPPIQRSLSPNPMGQNSARPVSPQPTVFYQTRPQYTPRYPPTHTMPVHVMYNRMSGPQPVPQRVSLRLPIMSQTLGRSHKTPPPYHYHIQQQNNEFPNPSEIRRRDGLNAYPHVWNQMPTAGSLPVPPVHHQNSQNPSPQNLSKDELEQFAEQESQRTERIKKRYSMTEDDDPSFGFARRPSVRGIRPKFESTNEILKQMQTPNKSELESQMAGSHQSWPQSNTINASYSNNNLNNNHLALQHSQTLPKKSQIVQIRFQQNPMPVKYMNDPSVPETTQSSQGLHPSATAKAAKSVGLQVSRTLPRPSSLISQSQMNAIRSEDGIVIRLPINVSREQLKQQIQRQLELQFQSKMKQKTTAMAANPKPMMSSNDERGAPEGASSSPKHSSDLLFAKNLSTNSSSGTKGGETSATKQTNDTNKLVINPDNTNTQTTNDSQGVVYYAMNV